MPPYSKRHHDTTTPITAARVVLAIDVGTTTVRCLVLGREANILSIASRPVELEQPERNVAEICPERLWQSVRTLINEALIGAGCVITDVDTIGISVQRGTFTTWNRFTGEVLHKLITWKDRRSTALCAHWNRSFWLRALRRVSQFAYFFTRQTRFIGSSQYELVPTLASARLLWAIQNEPKLQEAISTNSALFGTLDTYLAWRLSGGQIYATDPSNACVTGLYDPFQMCWSNVLLLMFGIPESMLPEVRDTSGFFGYTDKQIVGAAVPICALAGDQSASMFGHCGFAKGNIKITMGTGTFINVNTGSRPYGSFSRGVYPVVGWMISGRTTYLIETSFFDSAAAVHFAVANLQLAPHASQTSQIASSCAPFPGLSFVPAFSGLQAPENDTEAAACFIGLGVSTTKPQMLRAVLESIAYKTHQLMHLLRRDTRTGGSSTSANGGSHPYKRINVDGGISNCDLILRTLSSLEGGVPIARKYCSEMSALGAAFLAGLATGYFESIEDLEKAVGIKENIREPPNVEVRAMYRRWLRAVERSKKWYQHEFDEMALVKLSLVEKNI
ncbi:glycerol kinase-like [Tropilaelaps mercedesae]|uniref:Glycerol kinase 5 n=1 Tax=Tropilaelaps mercedesae TaxID=418985 RepID=A0A1V9X6U6_9ACAR|nr:glycerol kinase-like [Tropilaelaps mercedesae]